MTTLIDHPEGNYRFLPGIAPYSCGVVSAPGYEIVHVVFQRTVPYEKGFALIERFLATAGRPRAALCAIELRSPKPFSFDGFAVFNRSYASILERWGLFVRGINPVARTNVAPELSPPPEAALYGFSYSRPCEAGSSPTFVVARAGELPEGVLDAPAIVMRGETTAEAIAEKARFVMSLMEKRLRGLGVDWPAVTAADLYTIHPIHELLLMSILKPMGPAAAHGVRWFYSRPPIEEIEFEMDMRGVRSELRIDASG